MRRLIQALGGLILATAFIAAPVLSARAQDATSPLLQILLMGSGLHQNDWGTQTNTNLGKIESAIAGQTSILLGGSDYTLSDTEARASTIVLTGTLSASLNLIAPARAKSWILYNAAAGSFTITFKPSGGSGVVIPPGLSVVAWTDGSTMRLAGDTSSSATSAALASVSSVASAALPKAGGVMTGSIDLGGFTPTNSGAPSNGGDLTNKTYVDGAISTGIGGIQAIPAGAVMAFNLSACPSGWLEANGTATALDLRGEFIRGLDRGRGVDAGRALASAQTDTMQGHIHNWGTNILGSGVAANYASGGNNIIINSTTGANTSGPVSDGTNGAPRTGSETRPRNVALLYCVKS